MVFGIRSLALVLSLSQTLAFVVRQNPVLDFPSRTILFSTTQQDVLSLSLEKPLGIILEEVEENQPKGVYVCEIAEEGSASKYEDSLVGKKLLSVMDQDVRDMVFDDVMETLINAPSPVSVEFLVQEISEESKPELEIGTEVKIVVLNEDGSQTSIDAKVGDNLRTTLLENNVEVYKGLKKKLGNCGGGGQCTFCAAEFVEDEAWEERSDYENQKLKKAPKSRLTCLNNIQGPATIKI